MERRKEGGGVENREFPVLLLVSEGQLAHCQQIFTQLSYAEAKMELLTAGVVVTIQSTLIADVNQSLRCVGVFL